MKYIVERDCCTSGNCFRCTKVTPFGTPLRIEHGEWPKEKAAEVARNWKSHHATVITK